MMLDKASFTPSLRLATETKISRRAASTFGGICIFFICEQRCDTVAREGLNPWRSGVEERLQSNLSSGVKIAEYVARALGCEPDGEVNSPVPVASGKRFRPVAMVGWPASSYSASVCSTIVSPVMMVASV